MKRLNFMKTSESKLDQVVIAARQERERREKGYREQALGMYSHVCARCAREFNRKNLHELTVHHRDHNHDNNPSDGSNWELLCLYCHDNEHQRQLEAQQGRLSNEKKLDSGVTYNPFADLKGMLEGKK